jgi:hypothetical protein
MREGEEGRGGVGKGGKGREGKGKERKERKEVTLKANPEKKEQRELP